MASYVYFSIARGCFEHTFCPITRIFPPMNKGGEYPSLLKVAFAVARHRNNKSHLRQRSTEITKIIIPHLL
jgi:hypothetical protein